jgi:hypothetical protein
MTEYEIKTLKIAQKQIECCLNIILDMPKEVENEGLFINVNSLIERVSSVNEFLKLIIG